MLATFKTASLLDAYDVYQHLMDYRAMTMHDDCYVIARCFAAERDAIATLAAKVDAHLNRMGFSS